MWIQKGKASYFPLGFGGSAANVQGGKDDTMELLSGFESYYLKDEGKFIGGFENPTIADLSVRPALEFLKACDFAFPAKTKVHNVW